MTSDYGNFVENASDVDQRSIEVLAETLAVDEGHGWDGTSNYETFCQNDGIIDGTSSEKGQELFESASETQNANSDQVDKIPEPLHEDREKEQQIPGGVKEENECQGMSRDKHHHSVITPPAERDLPETEKVPVVNSSGESTLYYALTVAVSGDFDKEEPLTEEKTCDSPKDSKLERLYSLQGQSFDSPKLIVIRSDSNGSGMMAMDGGMNKDGSGMNKKDSGMANKNTEMSKREGEDTSNHMDTQRVYSEASESARTTSTTGKSPVAPGMPPSIQFVQTIPTGLQTLKVIPTLQHAFSPKFPSKVDDTHVVNVPTVTPVGHVLSVPPGNTVVPVPQYFVSGPQTLLTTRTALSGSQATLSPVLPSSLDDKKRYMDQTLDVHVKRESGKLTPVESFNNIFVFAKKVIIRTSLLMQYLFCTVAIFYCVIAITTPEWFRNTVEYTIDGIEGRSCTYLGLSGVTRSDSAKLKDGTIVTLHRGPIEYSELSSIGTASASEFVERAGWFRSVSSVGNLNEEKTQQFTKLYGNTVYDVVVQEANNLEFAGTLLFYLAIGSVTALGVAILFSSERALSGVVRDPWRVLMRNISIFLWLCSIGASLTGFILWIYWSGGSVCVDEKGKMVPAKLFYSAYFFMVYIVTSGLGLVFYIINCVALNAKKMPHFEHTGVTTTSIDIGA